MRTESILKTELFKYDDVAILCLNTQRITYLFKETLVFTGVELRGSWGEPPPPFWEPFLNKQPTTGGEDNVNLVSTLTLTQRDPR